MQADGYSNGEPIWQDHSSADDSRAADFYAGLFGWECPPGGEEYGGYRECRLNGKKVAGISPQMQDGPAAWSVYFKTDDPDRVAEKVTGAGGGVVVAPMQVGDFGTMAFFSDPTGALFGVWKPGTHHGAEARDEPGAVCWYELTTTDVDAAAGFYSTVFGWTARAHGPAGESDGYREFKLGDKTIGGLMAKPPMMPADAPPFWGVYFAVADADATAGKATELGGSVPVGPMDIAPGRFAVITDPTGAVFNILTGNR